MAGTVVATVATTIVALAVVGAVAGNLNRCGDYVLAVVRTIIAPSSATAAAIAAPAPVIVAAVMATAVVAATTASAMIVSGIMVRTVIAATAAATVIVPDVMVWAVIGTATATPVIVSDVVVRTIIGTAAPPGQLFRGHLRQKDRRRRSPDACGRGSGRKWGDAEQGQGGDQGKAGQGLHEMILLDGRAENPADPIWHRRAHPLQPVPTHAQARRT
ncbi:hypothetical protein RM190_02560 [Paracoccus sp. CPCC 101403]|uniref:Uncharacterized protein n=1 Tax=Paracoccus broussonetiae TaxID=3075834 RepID=A0ABU3E921_9RHOB|nr:hypothetical protein [Paracoccus sp. CPCC 101403]MDT1060721.1 hypothetical protein [Paracoccus sp. CPCC 101403]